MAAVTPGDSAEAILPVSAEAAAFPTDTMAGAMGAAFTGRAVMGTATTAAAIITTVAITAAVTTVEASIAVVGMEDGTADTGRIGPITTRIAGASRLGSGGQPTDGAITQTIIFRPIITAILIHPTCTIPTAIPSRPLQIQHGARRRATLFPPDNGDISMNKSTRNNFI